MISGRSGIADGIVPPVVFTAVNGLAGVRWGAAAGFSAAILITAARLLARRPLRFAVSGLAGTAAAAALVLRSGRAETYFLPGIVSGALTVVIVLVSIAARRPFVAWTSWVVRGWPLEWFWHPRVRPAYTAASWLWLGYFTARTSVQWFLYVRGETGALGLIRVATGWPGLVALLVATYLVGRSRLVTLAGPSVEEFAAGAPPPWRGQPTGF